ncbi:MAG: hypothetical protein E7E35_24815 [Klebsiella sp.]|uniref:hypothetical protein n=1 Tax=Klebsiella sp. TaxID=576 RepID=UPI002913A7D5|nr:hypothetical protein [Klebsiella sp.]MDU3360809.1 hypothetical protein [Klebsiella sp.]
MNIETVNELIQSLESAGELSIKERKYLELAKAYQQLAAENAELKSVIAENWRLRDVLRQLLNKRPGGVYFNKWEPIILEVLNAPCSHAEPAPIEANIARDAQRYRFLRDKDAFGDDGEPGLASWDELIELDMNEFDAAIDARMAHPSVDFLTLDNALQKQERRRCKDRNCNKQIFGYSVDGLCEDCYTAVSQQPAPVAPVCTCPSGDGSLRWPCPVHPGNSAVVPDGMERVATTLEDIGNFADAAIIRQLVANQQQNAPQNIPEIILESCTWTFSLYDEHWSGTCGAEWVFNDGGPEDNGVKFCPKCGKSVAVSATEGTEE